MPASNLHSFVLHYLADHDRVDLIELSELAGVTQQTLRMELSAIKAAASSGEPCFEELSSRYVEVTNRTVITRFLDARSASGELSSGDRVVLALVLSPDFVTMRRLASELFMSRSAVEKCLAKFSREGLLALETSRQRGVRLAADVEGRYAMLVRILRPYVDATDLEGSLRRFSEDCFPLGAFVNDGELAAACAFVGAVQELDSASYVAGSLEELLCHGLAVFWCVHRDLLLARDDEPAKGEVGDSDFGHYEGVVRRCLRAVGEEVPSAEEAYLVRLLMSLRKTCTHDNDAVVERMAPLVRQIVGEIKTRYSIDLTQDRKLLEGLSLHVWTTVIRGVSLSSEPVLYPMDDLRRTYPLGFELAAVAAEVIERRYGYLPKGNEIAYIALHLQAALERMGMSTSPGGELQAIIVCHYGLAASNLIAERLERVFSQLRVVGMYSVTEYRAHLDECDAIVSTEPLDDDGHPVFYVTPMLHEAELVPMSRFLEGRDRFDSRAAVMLLESVVVDLGGSVGRDDAIMRLAEALCEQGCVDHLYGESVIRRERVSPTSLDYIALPHGDPGHVLRTRLAVGFAPQGIEWDGSTVFVVLMLAFSSEGLITSPKFFSSFYRRLARSETERGLRKVAEMPGADCRRRMVRIVIGDGGR